AEEYIARTFGAEQSYMVTNGTSTSNKIVGMYAAPAGSTLLIDNFSDFASDLLGPWAGYFTGWTYWFCWVVTGMADVVAITAYAQF
ncbi:hypothetical protein MJL48_28300, partial [Salmonella enterica subsp. enterica serovar Kentucky]|nr:hypothetical protein [Salmonella enterica subsp. enterica serovar Kentucky]